MPTENANENRAHYAVVMHIAQKETSTFTRLQAINQQHIPVDGLLLSL